MAIELKKVGDIQTLALGFNYEASVDLTTDLGSTAGSATAVDIQVGGAAMAGLVADAAVVVDEVDVFSDSGNLGKIFRANGVLLNAATSSGHVVSAVDLTYNFTGNAPDDAAKGKIRILFKYYPTAGEAFSN